MNQGELKKWLSLNWPEKPVRAVLDTDAYNEVDDQYAIAYALQSSARLTIEAIYAAPFYAAPFFEPINGTYRSDSPRDGMEKSYDETLHVLDLMGRGEMAARVYKGAHRFLGWEGEPVASPAAYDLAERALAMPKNERLYVVSIAAITNVATALLLYPKIRDRIVVLWLGGHALHWKDNAEFNCMQDPYAAKVVFDSGVPLIQFPCMGVTSQMQVTAAELREALAGKNPLCSYLYTLTEEWGRWFKKCDCWSKTLWDVVPVAWLVGGEHWMEGHLVHSPVITNMKTYSVDTSRHFIHQIQSIQRDMVWLDVSQKLGGAAPL